MTGTRNRWKLMSTARAEKPPEQGKRRKLDDYETPPHEGLQLARFFKPSGSILEPACGSGRLVGALKGAFPGVRITGTDIKTGHDYTKRTKTWAGDIITNPPYRDGLADFFTTKSLELADGKVAMLLQSGFLWGSGRCDALHLVTPPELIIVLPYRVYFFEGPKGKPIKSQYFNHAWYCWPDRETRERRDYGTRVEWAPKIADNDDDFG